MGKIDINITDPIIVQRKENKVYVVSGSFGFNSEGEFIRSPKSGKWVTHINGKKVAT